MLDKKLIDKKLIDEIGKLFEAVIANKSVSDTDLTLMINIMNKFKKMRNEPKRIIHESISTTAEDNVHFKFEFKVPTDVFGAMVTALSQLLMPLQPNQNSEDFSAAMRLFVELMVAKKEMEGIDIQPDDAKVPLSDEEVEPEKE